MFEPGLATLRVDVNLGIVLVATFTQGGASLALGFGIQPLWGCSLRTLISN